MLAIVENGITRDDVALAALGDARMLAYSVEGDDLIVGEFLNIHGYSFHLVDEHFDAVERFLLLLLVDKVIIPCTPARVHTYFQNNQKTFRLI